MQLLKPFSIMLDFLSNILICRYNSFCYRISCVISFCNTNQLLIGLIFNVLWLYFNKSLILLKMCCTSISMYLFHISVHIGFIQVRTQFQVYVKFKRIQEFLVESQLKVEFGSRIYCIKLAPSSIGLSFMKCQNSLSFMKCQNRMRFFGIELAINTW